MNTDDKNTAQNYLLEQLNVSRETFSRLESFVELLLKWNGRINLISKNSEKHVWVRHILDSAQLLPFLKDKKDIIDLGSGAGLPGVVLSILDVKNIDLVDCDTRKCVFLQETKKFSQNNIKIHNCLFAETKFANIDIVIARAFSNIEKLLDITSGKMRKDGELMLLKGKAWQEEIATAKLKWQFDYAIFPSVTDKLGVIIRITNIKKR